MNEPTKNRGQRLREVVRNYLRLTGGDFCKGDQTKLAKYFGLTRSRVNQVFKEEMEKLDNAA